MFPHLKQRPRGRRDLFVHDQNREASFDEKMMVIVSR
jgi:hypothetical protein